MSEQEHSLELMPKDPFGRLVARINTYFIPEVDIDNITMEDVIEARPSILVDDAIVEPKMGPLIRIIQDSRKLEGQNKRKVYTQLQLLHGNSKGQYLPESFTLDTDRQGFIVGENSEYGYPGDFYPITNPDGDKILGMFAHWLEDGKKLNDSERSLLDILPIGSTEHKKQDSSKAKKIGKFIRQRILGVEPQEE